MRNNVPQTPKRVAAAAMAVAALTVATPMSAAHADTAQDRAITTYATGAVGDTFECGGIVGRLWCK